MAGLNPEQWALLVADACVYWEGLLAVGEEDLGHFGIMSTLEPDDEAKQFMERGYFRSDSTYQELQEFTRSLVQRYFVLGADKYGDLIIASEEGEFVGHSFELEEDEEEN
jgi:hypothetical protein